MIIYPLLPQVVSVGPVSFYTYGLLVGLALVIGLSLIERRAKPAKIKFNSLWRLLVVMLLGGLVGARAWHFLTDWQLYINNWFNIFNLRTGGLSILGAVAGSILALGVFSLWQKRKKRPTLNWHLVLDLVVFGLPLSQAVGRLGNFVNQELYGLPVKAESVGLLNYLPKLYVTPKFRLAAYKGVKLYHPLFLYELVLLLVIAGFIYLFDRKVRFFRLGQGRLFLFYLASYSLFRFFLEFLRLEKATWRLGSLELGVNQLVLLAVGLVSGGWLVFLWYQETQAKR